MSETAEAGTWRPEIGFGVRLRLIRIEFGKRRGRRLSQRQMAALLNVSEASYMQWEAGNARPSDIVATAKRIAAVTSADPVWLLNLEGPAGGPEGGSAQSRWTGTLVHLRRSMDISPLKLWRPAADQAA